MVTGLRSAKSGAKPGAKRACGSIFTADPNTPGDPVSGRQVCRCGLLGEAGDAHHTLPPAGDAQDEHRRRAGEAT